MSFFDDVSSNAKIYAGKVSRKADAAVEVSRLKIAENGLKRDISKSLSLLGAKVYKAYNVGDTNPDVAEDINKVRDMYDRLKLVRQQISDIKETEFTSAKSSDDNTAEDTKN